MVILSVLVVVLGGLTVWRKGRLGGFLCALGCVMAFTSMVGFYKAQTSLADLNAMITALASAILFGLGLVIHWLSKISAQLEGTPPRVETRRFDQSP